MGGCVQAYTYMHGYVCVRIRIHAWVGVCGRVWSLPSSIHIQLLCFEYLTNQGGLIRAQFELILVKYGVVGWKSKRQLEHGSNRLLCQFDRDLTQGCHWCHCVSLQTWRNQTMVSNVRRRRRYSLTVMSHKYVYTLSRCPIIVTYTVPAS